MNLYISAAEYDYHTLLKVAEMARLAGIIGSAGGEQADEDGDAVAARDLAHTRRPRPVERLRDRGQRYPVAAHRRLWEGDEVSPTGGGLLDQPREVVEIRRRIVAGRDLCHRDAHGRQPSAGACEAPKGLQRR